ncbi:DNA cytosine methyltransferase [Halomonas daqingensis]|uniref:DNA (cytosine-5-)-methyltransferase n=1 Tax=Billgrantia desiderata TaxID=52021 RepID=A0ABS9B4Q4_9GAMM|nr:DNA cytosine methyltransferase [Halomonas desiderata]MCE8042486.1 DNA cytosine methyltransferase [Halomonas desiderata]MCE8047061.1 DNA cytosine methyltransferase [Halomonas desiderata]
MTNMNLNLFGHELVVDNFAGGGGASEGIEQALGRLVDLAINHDSTAIAVHTANHPGSEHAVADVWDIDPEQATHGMPVGLAWFSPDCRHHSKAKGGRPVSKSVRGLAWVAARWAAKVKPRVIALENVEEFLDWGPLIKDADGKCRPDPSRKGQTFRGFVRALNRHGYQVDWKILRACDYGAPTIRKRLFLVARRDGLPIVWPKPTHGDPASPAVRRGKLQPWRTAAECIDWSIPCPSIFDRERPLAENTLKRIAKGVMRYVIEAAEPFIISVAHGYSGGRREYPLGEPLGTVSAGGVQHALVSPHITKFRSGAIGHGCDEPMHTITANSNATDSTANPGGCAPFGLVSATIAPCVMTNTTGHPGAAVDEPLRTVTTGGHHALVAAFLAKHYGGVVGADLRQPLPTITATDHNAPVAVSLLNLKGSDRGGSDITQPMPTICAGGTHAAAVAAFLAPYYGSGSGETGRDMRAPAPTITTKDRFQLVTVTIGGEQYAIVDIGMRMLQPHELAAAQGFPPGYQFAEVEGKPVPKYAQVRLIGNSVCPPLARAIVEANFTHERRFMAPTERAVA